MDSMEVEDNTKGKRSTTEKKLCKCGSREETEDWGSIKAKKKKKFK